MTIVMVAPESRIAAGTLLARCPLERVAQEQALETPFLVRGVGHSGEGTRLIVVDAITDYG